MPFRDFFTILGLLAVTALLVVIVVEKSLDSTPNAPSSRVSGPAASTSTTESVTESSTVNEFKLTLTATPFKANGHTFDASMGAINVQQQRGRADSSTIELPVVRIKAQTQTPGEPVLLLGDGPGVSNLWSKHMPTWLLNEHDLFMVGYRGVDGSINLALPEFKQALIEFGLDGQSVPLAQAAKRGFQRLEASGVRLENYTLVDVVEDLDEVFEALNIEKVSLYSVGFGARVAYRYAVAHPQRVKKMVMLGPKGFGAFAGSSSLDEAIADRAQRLNWGDFLLKTYTEGTDNQLDKWPALNALFETLSLKSTTPNPTAMVDALVVYGSLDPHLSNQALKALLHDVPRTRLVKLASVAHIEDILGLQSGGLSRLVSGYLRDGTVDVSGFFELKVKIHE